MKCTDSVRRLNQETLLVKRSMCQEKNTHHKVFCEVMHVQNVVQLHGPHTFI